MSPLRRFCALGVGTLLVALVGLLILGCGPRRLEPPAPEISAQKWLDRSAPPGGYPDVERAVVESLNHPGPGGPMLANPPLNVLVLSGGGKFGAFTAGVLVGWTDAGTRPTFDVVTGISSGALEGAFAFLGPKYDSVLQRFACSTKASDLFAIHPLYYLCTKGAIASFKPLERMIATIIDDEFMDGLRQAHASGRRLFIGTAVLKTKRLVVWDMGALASSGKPDACALVRKVLLAAIAIPGLVPPVRIEIEINGHPCVEEHCDGGSAALAFLRFGPLPNWPRCGAPARDWLLGSNLFVLTAGKLYADPIPGKMSLGSRLQSAVSSSLYALHRDAVRELHTLCAVSGMKFHLIALPEEVEASPATMDFRPGEMQRLFDVGYEMARRGVPWRQTPPGGDPGEEERPRAGVSFDVLPEPVCPAPGLLPALPPGPPAVLLPPRGG